MRLASEAAKAAGDLVPEGDRVVLKNAFDAGAEDVLASRAIILCTPANFGYMSGALKDFFERIYDPCLDVTAGKPYLLVVKGDTDVTGAIESVERIATGLKWRKSLLPIGVEGPITADSIERVSEAAATLVAGCLEDLF